jgi:hypothetical protein
MLPVAAKKAHTTDTPVKKNKIMNIFLPILEVSLKAIFMELPRAWWEMK